LRLDVQDQGGRGRFVTPDGRKLEIILHSDDWPFAVERDALILVIRDQGSQIPFATAWSSIDEEDVVLNLNWLRIRCSAEVPDSDDLRASTGIRRDGGSPVALSDAPAAPGRRYPSTGPG
jgi:hypothetical protein